MRLRWAGLLLLFGLIVSSLSVSWVAASEPKPYNWAPVGVATTAPEWGYFWNHARMVLPFWGNRVGAIDLITGLRPTVNGGPTIQRSTLGLGVDADTGDRLIYQVGTRIGFDKDTRWSVGVIMEFRNIVTDQSTILAKSSETPEDGAPRQLIMTVLNGAAPNEVRVQVDEEPGGNTVYITSAAIIEEDIPYLFILTQDGVEGLTLYVADLFSNSLVVDGITGTQSITVDTAQNLHLLAHFSDTNDDAVAIFSYLWYLDGHTMNPNEVIQMISDPFGMLRMADETSAHSIQDVAAAVPQIIIIGWTVPDWLGVVISNLGLAQIGLAQIGG